VTLLPYVHVATPDDVPPVAEFQVTPYVLAVQVAFTVTPAASIVKLQAPVPEQDPPVHPAKVYPVFAPAFRVTAVP